MQSEFSVHASEPPPRQSLAARLLHPKVGIPLILLVLLVALPFWYRAWRVSGIPDIGPPFDVEKHGTVELADEDNAIFEYREAAALVTPLDDADKKSLQPARENGWSHVSDNLKAWLDANRPALEPWKRGTKKPDMLLIQPRALRLDTQLTELDRLGRIGNVAMLEGLRLESDGKLDEAWELHRAAFRASRHAGRHGGIIARFVGIALHAIAASDIVRWSRNNELTERQLLGAMAAVRDHDKLQSPLSTLFQAEYFVFLDTINRSDLDNVFDIPPDTKRLAIIRTLMFLENEQVLGRRIFEHALSNLLAHCDEPRPTRRTLRPLSVIQLFEETPEESARAGRLSIDRINVEASNCIMARHFLPSLNETWIAVDRERIRQAALIAVLAVEAYRRRFGDYPTELQAVVDAGLLDAIPVDPHSPNGGPVLMRRTETSLRIYGVSDNGADDGGDVHFTDGHQATDIGYEIPQGKDTAANEKH